MVFAITFECNLITKITGHKQKWVLKLTTLLTSCWWSEQNRCKSLHAWGLPIYTSRPYNRNFNIGEFKKSWTITWSEQNWIPEIPKFLLLELPSWAAQPIGAVVRPFKQNMEIFEILDECAPCFVGKTSHYRVFLVRESGLWPGVVSFRGGTLFPCSSCCWVLAWNTFHEKKGITISWRIFSWK